MTEKIVETVRTGETVVITPEPAKKTEPAAEKPGKKEAK